MACCPGVNLSLYCSALAAVMVNSGCSLGNGSDRKPAASAVPAFFGKPPVQAGIEPSALPAISAPTGVSVVPSLAASSGDTAAMTLQASSERVSAPVCNRLFVVFIYRVFLKIPGRLEVHTEAECNEIAVDRRVVVATEEVGVGQAGVIGVLVVGIQPQADGLAAFVEQAIGAVAIHIMRPGHARLEVDASEHARVFENGASAIAPGGGSYETVVIGCAVGTIDGVATVLQILATLEATDVGDTDFADHGQATGAQYLVEEMGQGGLRLGQFLAAITLVFGTERSIDGG